MGESSSFADGGAHWGRRETPAEFQHRQVAIGLPKIDSEWGTKSALSAAREAQPVRLRGTLNVDLAYDEIILSIDSEWTDADRKDMDSFEGKDKTEKPKRSLVQLAIAVF